MTQAARDNAPSPPLVALRRLHKRLNMTDAIRDSWRFRQHGEQEGHGRVGETLDGVEAVVVGLGQRRYQPGRIQGEEQGYEEQVHDVFTRP